MSSWEVFGTILSVCVRSLLYCMYRRGEIQVVLGTGSAQINVFISKTVCTSALVTTNVQKRAEREKEK